MPLNGGAAAGKHKKEKKNMRNGRVNFSAGDW